MSTMFVPTWIGASQKKWVILIPGENTRIRCVKSIKGYPFNPAMSEIHCCELKRKVSKRQRWIYKRILTIKDPTVPQVVMRICNHLFFKTLRLLIKKAFDRNLKNFIV